MGNSITVDFDTALDTFVAAINDAFKASADEHENLVWTETEDGSDVPDGKIGYFRPVSITRGKRYAKVISNNSGSPSVYCFVDLATGAIFKPASWSTPAKGARGSIYDMPKYVEQGIDFSSQRWLYR